MTHQQTLNGGFNRGTMLNGLRAVLAGVVALALVGLVLMLAAFLTMAAFVVAGVAALAAGGWWLYRKVRGRKSKTAKDTVLVARRGPHGWTVDGDQPDGA